MAGETASPRALSVDGAVELAHIDREGMVESRHLGAAVIADSAGHIVRVVGDAHASVYPRSTLKPLQAIAMLQLGARFADDELALATASHCGSSEHLAVVERMLHDDGRDARALQCPAQWPLGRAELVALQQKGLPATRVTMNCSGKHAGFLRASDAIGADPQRYLHPEHPVQRRVAEVVEQYTGEPIHHSARDGCGAPLHATSLLGLAGAIARIAAGETVHEQRLVAAITAEPWAIDGHGRANTLVIERLGAIAKIGAEGLVVIGVPSGVAVAVKILDGSMRATTPVALALLASVGAIDADAARELTDMVAERALAGDEEVGRLTVSLS